MVATILSESISVYNTELLLLYCFTTFLLLIFGLEPIIEQAAASKCYSFFFQSRLNNFLSTISDKPFDTQHNYVWLGSQTLASSVPHRLNPQTTPHHPRFVLTQPCRV